MPTPNLIRDEICPFCDSRLQDLPGAIVLRHSRSLTEVKCPVCGDYTITGEAIDLLPMWNLPDDRRAAVAFAVRRMTDRPQPPYIDTETLRALRDTARLPRPEQMLDEAVFWIGRHSAHVGQMFQITFPEWRSVLGAWHPQAFNFVAEWIAHSGFFHAMYLKALSSAPIPVANCYLTPAGWEHYRKLTEANAASRFGFMAMNYGDAELDSIVRLHFEPEVRKTGFELRRLDEGQPAGLIDDQLRVAIRTARFVVCDLTHGNRGAYWESGFAEGLGRPVIYTCRKDVFDDQKHEHHPHFDTNHMVTVIWDSADPAAAARRLKQTIRATLPAEAQLTD